MNPQSSTASTPNFSLFCSTAIGLIGLSMLSLTSCPTASAATLYTTQASFLSQVDSGYYLENFDAKTSGVLASGTNFSNSTYTYTASTTTNSNGLYIQTVAGNKSLSTNTNRSNIVINFTSNNVTAVGGNFFLSGGSSSLAGAFSISLSDGTNVTLNSTDSVLTAPFEGFTAADGTNITSLTFAVPTINSAAAIDDLIVGRAKRLPEPSSIVGTLLSASLLILARNKIKKGRQHNN